MASRKINSIEKALEILLKFQEKKPSWGIRELATELHFSPATVQRILQSLKAYHFVRQDPDTRQYYIGNIFYRFLENLSTANDLTRISRKFMEELAAATLETVHLNVIENKMRVCIDNIDSPNVLKAGMPIGNQSPLYAGASAKCLLAYSSEKFQDHYFKTTAITPMTKKTIVMADKLFEELYRIKKTGYALSLGERTPGLGSVSAPVFDCRGQILASLSLAIPEVRFKKKAHLTNCIALLTRSAASLSNAMGMDMTPGIPLN